MAGAEHAATAFGREQGTHSGKKALKAAAEGRL